MPSTQPSPVQTIEATFNPKDLPAWTRKHPAVIKLAERDLGFRCDVYQATSKIFRACLIRHAERLAS